MNSITMAEILRGVTPGRMQSVGYMQIIPLVTELVDERFIPPTGIYSSTSDYGTVNIENRGSGMTILPMGTGYVVKQAAQNHAIPTAKLVKAGERATINTAACIQSSQGGTIRAGQHPMTIIPWALKEAAIMTRNRRQYQKLWGAIEEFNKRLGLMSRGHLELYLEKFKDDLDNFIAQFEVVPNQVGAIVLLNGYVMGVERAPNYEYWKAIWKPLIRECYGSLSLQFAKEAGPNPPLPKTRVPLKRAGIDTLKDVEKAYTEAKGMEDDVIRGTIRKFIKEKFKRSHEEKSGSIEVETLEHKQFKGQVVRDNDKILYASFVTTSSWNQNHDWYEADEFRI